MLGPRARLAGTFAAGKCTSIRFSRFPGAGCNESRGVGVAELLVRGVVYPLPKDGVAEVKTVDESDATLESLRRPVGRFADDGIVIALSCGGATCDGELATTGTRLKQALGH